MIFKPQEVVFLDNLFFIIQIGVIIKKQNLKISFNKILRINYSAFKE
jgi:hypothetical protein